MALATTAASSPQRLAAALDGVRTAVVAVADLSQARTAALMDQRLTGVAAFGTDGTPGSSGLMVLEYVAADLAARLRALAVPATLTRTSVSLGLEEVASHATQSALLARQQAALLPDLLACELVAAEGAGGPDRVLGPSWSTRAAASGSGRGSRCNRSAGDRVLWA